MDTAKKLVHLEVVKEMADQEINVLKEILLTDPTRINSAIDIWTKKKQKASPEEQARCDKNIANLYDILEKAIETTLRVYDIESNPVVGTTTEVVNTTEKEPTMVHQPPTAEEKVETPEEDPSKTALRVVKDDDALAEKYKDIIKKLSVDELKKHLITLTQEDANQAAHYILSKGLYHATNPKTWNDKKINGLLKEVAKAKAKKEGVKKVVSESITLDEKYKDSIGKYTLAEVGEIVKDYVSKDKPQDALEFATYILSKKAYKDAEKEDLEWTDETITTFIDQVVTGMSSETKIEEATVVEDESPFYDITYGEVYKLVDEKAQAEGATIESVKAFFVDFMNTNTEKSIEKIDDLIEQSNIDTVWTDLFEQTIAYRIKSLNEKRQAEQFEKEHEELKTSILEKHLEENIIAKKKEYEEGTLKLTDGVTEIKKLLIERGFVNTSLQTAKQYFMDMARRAALNVKWLKSTPSPLPETTETDSSEPVAIIGPQVSVDDKFPEIKTEVENAKYLEDMYFLSKKYVTDEEKNAYVLQLIANAFADKKVFETSKSEEALDWTIEQVQAWLNSEAQTDKPVVDAQTDLHPKEEEQKTESNSEESANSENEWKKIFCNANDKAKFVAAIVDFIKKSKEEGKDIKTIRSECVELIQFSAKNNKKSFARSSYKRAQIGELHNTINKIAIAAEIDGFMNEPKQ